MITDTRQELTDEYHCNYCMIRQLVNSKAKLL